jgi:hypothetical protein
MDFPDRHATGDPNRWTDDPEFAALEAAYATYQDAWGAWMVGHHRGSPVDPGAGDEAAVTARMFQARMALGQALVDLDARALRDEDAAALANILGSLPELDTWPEPLAGLTFPDTEPGRLGRSDVVTVTAAGAAAPPEDPEIAVFRRRTFDAWGEAMANLDADGVRIDRYDLLNRLGREPDPPTRRRLFLAMAPGWRAAAGEDGSGIDGSPYRRLLQSSAERWRRYGSPVALNAAALGLDPGSVEATLRRILATYREIALPGRIVEPWDYRYEIGGLDRRIDPLIPVERLREINDSHLASIGADPTALGINYDIFPRPDRPVVAVAFCVSYDIARRSRAGWRAATPWVFSVYSDGGLGNLEELLHESGHALHAAATRARPAMFSWPADQAAFVEAVADVVGWTTHEPAFLSHHLGVDVSARESVIARYRTVAIDSWWGLFELELHRHPDRDPNEVWAEIAERDMGVIGHPEWPWWAHRGQLIDVPGYVANYPLGAIMVAAVRARIRELRGDWATGDPGWYAFVSERLLRFGGARTPRAILGDLLEGPLTAGPLLADLERGA